MPDPVPTNPIVPPPGGAAAPEVPADVLDSRRVPEIPIDEIAADVGETSAPRSLASRLSESERAAAKRAARAVSVEDVLAVDGIDRIHREVTGTPVDRSSAINPEAALKDLGDELSSDLQDADRLIRAATATEKTHDSLMARMSGSGRSLADEPQTPSAEEVKEQIVDPLIKASMGAANLGGRLFRTLISKTRRNK